MTFNYNKLRGRIVEIFDTQQEFASKIKCSEHTISRKLSNKVNWKQDEIVTIINALDLTIDDIPEYFFNQKVQKK